MTILEDAQAEYDGLVGEELTYYPPKEPQDEGDEFWYDDEQGWDRNNGTDFEGTLESTATEETLERAGFQTDVEGVIRSSFTDSETGGLVEGADSEWIVVEETELRYSGGSYGALMAVRQRKP